jgi:hypothetical protein
LKRYQNKDANAVCAKKQTLAQMRVGCITTDYAVQVSTRRL